MQGLKFRKTDLMIIIKESLAAVVCPSHITVDVKSTLYDYDVWMDHNQMVTVLKDLEQNAFDSMTDKGLLTIFVGGDEKEVILKISDTGKGIPEENMPMLFTPFFTTKAVGDGTGLGLPQAFATIKSHNGDITIESNNDPGKGPTGTTVNIKIPRKQKFQTQEARIILHEEGDRTED